MYSKNATVALALNPTYVHSCILFSNPRLIIKLTLLYYVLPALIRLDREKTINFFKCIIL